MNKIILPGLTTTEKSDWRAKVEEIDELGLREVALFPTCLEIEQRKELYKLLEGTNLESIPHVHLRGNDMEKWELEYFIEKYNSQVFNIHPNREDQVIFECQSFKKMTYVENQEEINGEYVEFLKNCAGVCLDVSHWEDQGVILGHAGYENFSKILETHKIGCCHVSVVKNKPRETVDYLTGKKLMIYSSHWLEKMEELDYVKKYVQYLPKHVSIELENSFREQLEVKKYLEKIIN